VLGSRDFSKKSRPTRVAPLEWVRASGLDAGMPRGPGYGHPSDAASAGEGAPRTAVSRESRRMVKGNWALFEEDFWAINSILQTLIQSASARSVMLIDKTGQLVSSIGEPPGFDITSFSSLTAADFAANQQLRRWSARRTSPRSFTRARTRALPPDDREPGDPGRPLRPEDLARPGAAQVAARGDELLTVLNASSTSSSTRMRRSPRPPGRRFRAEAESEIDHLFKD